MSSQWSSYSLRVRLEFRCDGRVPVSLLLSSGKEWLGILGMGRKTAESADAGDGSGGKASREMTNTLNWTAIGLLAMLLLPALIGGAMSVRHSDRRTSS